MPTSLELRRSAVPALTAGAWCGLVFGTFEVILAYGTGTLHRLDAIAILAFDVLAWTSAALAGFGVASLGRLEALTPTIRGLLLAPVLVLLVRTHPSLDGGQSLSWVLFLGFGTAAGGLAVAIRRVERPPQDSMHPLARDFALVQGLATLAVAGPASSNPTSRELADALGSPATETIAVAYCAVLLLVTRATGAAPHRRLTQLSGATSLLIGGGCAWLLGGTWPRPVHVAEASNSAKREPNILLITLDTVRRDHLSCYGYARETSPHLDALGSRAIVYANAYASSPYTLASHASLFTGLLPHKHGARPVPYVVSAPGEGIEAGLTDFPLAPEHDTLAQELQRRGYRTGGIVANNGYLSEWTGLSRGFDYYDSNSSRLSFGYVPLVLPVALRLHQGLFEKLTHGAKWKANQITDAAISWLERTPARPFFLFLNYLDPHHPYEPPPSFARKFSRRRQLGPASLERLATAVSRGGGPLEAEERAYLRDLYDDEIAFTDQEVGRLLHWLEGAGLMSELLLIVTSDHGEFLGERDLLFHANAVYEPVLGIPLIVKLPGQQEPERREERIGLDDLRSMIRQVLDTGALPAGGSGRAEEPRIVAEHWTSRMVHELNPARHAHQYMRAAYAKNLKLIERADDTEELYDLSRDPDETLNLLSAGPGTEEAMFRAAFVDLPSIDIMETHRSSPPADSEVLERLRALGYVR